MNVWEAGERRKGKENKKTQKLQRVVRQLHQWTKLRGAALFYQGKKTIGSGPDPETTTGVSIVLALAAGLGYIFVHLLRSVGTSWVGRPPHDT